MHLVVSLVPCVRCPQTLSLLKKSFPSFLLGSTPVVVSTSFYYLLELYY